jgi:hypothetical protein
VSQIQAEQVALYKRYLLDAGLASAPRATVLSGLRSFLRYARHVQGLAVYDPEKVWRPTIPRQEVAYLTKAEVGLARPRCSVGRPHRACLRCAVQGRGHRSRSPGRHAPRARARHGPAQSGERARARRAGGRGAEVPVRFRPPKKMVVLALATSKTGVLEDQDTLKRRIDQAP